MTVSVPVCASAIPEVQVYGVGAIHGGIILSEHPPGSTTNARGTT